MGILTDYGTGGGIPMMSGGGIGVVVEGLINQTDQLSEYEKRKRLFKMLEEK